MPTRQIVVHVVVHVVDCDVCGQPFERDDMVIHFTTAGEGVDYAVSAGWLGLDDGQLICTNSDFIHDLARIPSVAA
jgi:hypothetical protein